MGKMKRSLLPVLFLFLTLHLFAGIVSPELAIRVAENLMLERSGKAYLNSTITNLNSTNQQGVIYFVHLNPAGFVIVSGDDAANPILGYSDSGRWGEADFPPQLSYFISNWSEQIGQIRSMNLPQDTKIRELWQHYAQPKDQFQVQRDLRAVSPLITSTWGQGSPYNALCPSNTPVGCVATAMSQIMRYWAYPTTGSGTHSYYHPTYGTQSADFGNTVYNWASMPNSTSSSNSAVATICRHTGVSVDMDYGPDGSGAYSFDVPAALTTYFKYKDTASWKQKSSYSEANWEALMRGELDNYRPVYYSGSSTESGGHAFVMDGYSGTNYFHINWGWYGYYNGYFYLSALNPGTDNFTSSQQAVIGIQPREQFTNLTEGFEGTTFPPIGWSRSATSWNRSTSNSITGTASAYYNGSANGVRLVTPKLTIDASSTLTFKARRSNLNRYEYLKIRTSVNGSTWTDFYSTAALTQTATSYEVSFSALTPGDYYLCFEANSTNNNAQTKSIFLDDVNGPQIWVDPNPIANLNLSSWAAGSVAPGNSASSGAIFSLTNIGQGVLTISSVTNLSTTEFSSTLNTNIALVAGQSHEFGFAYDPIDYGSDNQSYVITTSGGTVTVTLSGTAPASVYSDGFETYTDFTLDISPWTQYDGDGSTTYGITDVTWANSGYTGSFIVYDPTATVPAISGAEAHGGSQYAACFAATTPPNNDWLISPRLSFGANPRISFWARSYVADYGLERFKVLVSTTGNSYSNFTTYLAGSATTYISAPVTWTQYSYNLPANCANNSNVYIAIQCVSNDAFFLLIDDFLAQDDSVPPPPQLGHLSGYVYRSGTSTPIANALVQIGSKTAYTNTSGYYLINNILAGTYSVTASTPGAFYFNSSASGVVISNNLTTSQDFNLTWAEMQTNHSSFTSNLYLGQSESQVLAISNPGGTASLQYALSLSKASSSGSLDRSFSKKLPPANATRIAAPLALPQSKDSVAGWISYTDIADVSYLSASVTERATKFSIGDFGMWSNSGLTISQLRAYFYEATDDLWGTEDTFQFKIYAADGVTVLHTSGWITALKPTTSWTATDYTLPTPITVSGDFWVAVVPEGTTSGKPYTVAADYDYGTSFYGSAGSWTAMGIENIFSANISGNRWISVNPTSGTVSPAGTANVNLSFDTTDLAAGAYNAYLTIYNNSNYIAPSGSLKGDNMVIPITLNVTEASEPLASLNANYWQGVAPVNGTTSSGSIFQLKNIGTGTLTITSAILSGAAFTTTFNSSVTLTAGATHNFGFSFNPLAKGIQTGTFDIVTNGGSFTINLKGYGDYQSIDFEGATFPPTNWTIMDVDADTYNWQNLANASYAHGGNNCAVSASYIASKEITDSSKGQGRGALTPDNWLISPRIRIQSGDELSYYIGALDPAWPAEKYSVMISTTTNQLSAFTNTLFTETMTDGSWHLRTLSLSAFTGMDIYLAFRHYDCTDQYMLRLDDILIPGLAPNSPLPAINPEPANGTTVYSFTPGGVTLAWQANPSGLQAIGYKLYLDESLVAANLTTPGWTTPTLSSGIHTWKVIPFDGSKGGTSLRSPAADRADATDCPTWTFTYTPYAIIPEDPTVIDPDAVLSHDGTDPLIYNSEIVPPAGIPAGFQSMLSFSLSGTGTVNISITTAYTDAAVYLGSQWHLHEAVDGVISFVCDLDAKGEAIISLGNYDNTLPVELSAFTATINAQNKVMLMWITESESNCLGYNIYRNNELDLETALNLQVLIEGTNTSQQQSYVYVDQDLNSDGLVHYWLQSLEMDGSSAFYGPLSIEYYPNGGNQNPALPLVTQLIGAYPNPFNPSTTISYAIDHPCVVRLEVFNSRGQLVRSITENHNQPGFYSKIWDGKSDLGVSVGSGIYLYRMSAGSFSSTKRFIMLK